MTQKKREPSVLAPATSTVAAIGNFFGPFAALVDHSSAASIMLLVFCEMVVIGVAAWQWFHYFKAYIDFKIDGDQSS